MSEKTRLGSAITYLLAKHNWSQKRLCEVTGITSSVASETINKAKRPEVKTLIRLCTCWPEMDSIRYAVMEHLRDECERAGENPDNLQVSFGSATEDGITAALQVLEHVARRDAVSAEWLEGTAALMRKALPPSLRSVPADPDATRLAADPRPAAGYPAPKSPRKPRGTKGKDAQP